MLPAHETNDSPSVSKAVMTTQGRGVTPVCREEALANAEAAGIEPLVRHSPLLSWLYPLTSVKGASEVIGVIELLVAALIAARRFSPRAAAAGSIGAVAVFVATLTFLVSTPGIWVMVPGFPWRSPTRPAPFS